MSAAVRRELTDTERWAITTTKLAAHLGDDHVHTQRGRCVYCSCGARLYQGAPMTAEQRAAALTLAREMNVVDEPKPKAGGKAARPPKDTPLRAAPPARSIPAGTQRCTSEGCGAEIDWAITQPGNKPMPVDHRSAGQPGGNLAVWRRNGKLYASVLKAGEDPPPGTKRGMAHWATCTKAQEHKADTAIMQGAAQLAARMSPAGWSHSLRHHRWELRQKTGGNVVAFRHDQVVADAAADPETWAAFRAAIAGAYGVPFPEEAPPQHMPSTAASPPGGQP